MFNPLILMVAGAKKADPVVPGVDPNPLEPYRVLWNADAQYLEVDRYVYPLPDTDAVLVENYAVLSDHDDLKYPPIILVQNSSGFADTPGGGKIYSIVDPLIKQPFRIDKITDIAYPIRNGVEPKVFAIRVDLDFEVTNMSLFNYCLDFEGTKFFGLRMSTTKDSKLVQPVYDFGDGLKGGMAFHSEDGALDDIIRLVVYEDKLEVRYGEPGTLAVSFNIPPIPKPQADAHLNLLEAHDVRFPAGDNSHNLRYLAIYDGTF